MPIGTRPFGFPANRHTLTGFATDPQKGFPVPAHLSHRRIRIVPNVCFITRRITSGFLFYMTYYVFSPDWFVKSGRTRFLIRVLSAKRTFTYIIERRASSSDRTSILTVFIQAGELSDDTVTQP